jgi:hypothetical protein
MQMSKVPIISPFLALRVYVNMSENEIHETGGV